MWNVLPGHDRDEVTMTMTMTMMMTLLLLLLLLLFLYLGDVPYQLRGLVQGSVKLWSAI